MNLRDLDVYFNYHTHTNRNGHGNRTATDEDYVRAAMETGIRILGFSEHCPYQGVSQPMARPGWDVIPEYFSSLGKLKEKYRDRCEILIGFECEYYPNHIDDVRKLKEMSDYIILGQHFNTVDSPDFYCYAFRCGDEGALEYTENVLKGLDTGMYDILAHPDYFFGGTNDIDDVFVECAHRICQKCEETKTPMEINFNGVSWHAGKNQYKQGPHYFYPNRLFWEIACKYDIRCVIGLDAHDPDVFRRRETLFNMLSEEVDDLGLEFLTEPFLHAKER